jgi:oxygen-dependent protoporphyrinogen oxidase
MERDHRSLVRGMLAASRARARSSGEPATGGAFFSLEGGVETLVHALAARLATDGAVLRTNARVRGLSRATSSRWRLDVEGADSLEADAVLVAAPAHAAARVLVGIDEELCKLVGALQYGSTVTVFFAYRRADVTHPLDGVGFIVPSALDRLALASTWVSSKWSHRAPDGHVLLRVFLGGARRESLLAGTDAELTELARTDLRALMGLGAEPLWSRVFRFERASAQMRVGHLSAMRAIHQRMAQVAPGVTVAGGGYGVTGIPDCIREGQGAARGLLETLS